MSSTPIRHADVIVVGAGILGTFHAYFAARKGYKTLLLERNHYPNDASTRNFGMVVQTIVETGGVWAQYARATREIYRSLQQEHDISVRPTGSLYLASTELERRVLAEFAEVYAASYHCYYLKAEEVLARYPFVRADYCSGGLLFPDDLTVDPGQLLRRLIPHLVREKLIEYLPQTAVIAVESSHQGQLVRDVRGNCYTADTVIICSGTEYQMLFPEHFLQSELQICKLQMQRIQDRPGFSLEHSILSGLSIRRYPAFKACPSYAALSAEAVDADLLQYGIHLLFKQAADGTIIVGDSHEYRQLTAEYRETETTDPAINAAILRYGRRMLDLPTWEMQRVWNGYYMLHPRDDVYTAKIDAGVHIVTGIGGKGMSTGAGFSQQHIENILK